MSELRRFVPEGAHVAVEERQHRGQPVYALVAIVPHGGTVVLNGYSTSDLAEGMRARLDAELAEGVAS